MIAFLVIVGYEVLNRGPQQCLSEEINRSKQDSLMLRTNHSAWAFKFGDRGGSFTDSTPASAKS